MCIIKSVPGYWFVCLLFKWLLLVSIIIRIYLCISLTDFDFFVNICYLLLNIGVKYCNNIEVIIFCQCCLKIFSHFVVDISNTKPIQFFCKIPFYCKYFKYSNFKYCELQVRHEKNIQVTFQIFLQYFCFIAILQRTIIEIVWLSVMNATSVYESCF